MPAPFFARESAYVDADVTVGDGTRIWHFSHIMSGSRIDRNCNIGQNVVISPGVVIGDNVKIQNNVSVYTGVTIEDVFCGPSMGVHQSSNPRSPYLGKTSSETRPCGAAPHAWCQLSIVYGHSIGAMPSSVRGRRHAGCARFRARRRKSRPNRRMGVHVRSDVGQAGRAAY